ncbi:hypothetical protein K474DRAFT_1710150 [Panus rudis PR-1116 ss-1]|nr:hypothetical protein K474DRAFT_1710150 [Panus rudis PR-1116 ss-1]
MSIVLSTFLNHIIPHMQKTHELHLIITREMPENVVEILLSSPVPALKTLTLKATAHQLERLVIVLDTLLPTRPPVLPSSTFQFATSSQPNIRGVESGFKPSGSGIIECSLDVQAGHHYLQKIEEVFNKEYGSLITLVDELEEVEGANIQCYIHQLPSIDVHIHRTLARAIIYMGLRRSTYSESDFKFEAYINVPELGDLTTYVETSNRSFDKGDFLGRTPTNELVQ